MDELQTVAISSLSPSLDAVEAKVIRATVTLLWPYSSSTRTTALLLAEPDFRLRRKKGQVRVDLRRASAEAVAKSRIGIGDDVLLSLRGVGWVDNADSKEVIRTPGKSVDWDLKFDLVLRLRVFRGSREVASLDVNGSSPSPSPQQFKEASFPSTPAKIETNAQNEDWRKSVLFKRSRLSGEVLTFSPYDPFKDDDKRPHKKLRGSWHGVGSWRLASRTPSPEKVEVPDKFDAADFGEDIEASAEDVAADSIHSPILYADGSPRAKADGSAALDHLREPKSANSRMFDIPGFENDRLQVYRDSFEAQKTSHISNHQTAPQNVAAAKHAARETPDLREISSDGPDEAQDLGNEVVVQERLLFEEPEDPALGGDEARSEEPGAAESDLGSMASQKKRFFDDTSDVKASPPVYKGNIPSICPPTMQQPAPQSPAFQLDTSKPPMVHLASPGLPLSSTSPHPVNGSFPREFDSSKSSGNETSSRIKKPEIPVEKAAIERESLPAQENKDRKQRTVSASSRRSGNGPFGEHFRAKAPFGIDCALEEAVIDESQEEAVIRKSQEKAQSDIDASELPPHKTSDVLAQTMPEVSKHSPPVEMDTQEEAAQKENDQPHQTNWEIDDWLEPPTGDFDDFVVNDDFDMQDAPYNLDDMTSTGNTIESWPLINETHIPSSPILHAATGENQHDAQQLHAQAPTSTMNTTIIDLGEGSSSDVEDQSSPHRPSPETFNLTQGSIELGSTPMPRVQAKAAPNVKFHISKTGQMFVKDSEEGSLYSDASVSTVLQSHNDLEELATSEAAPQNWNSFIKTEDIHQILPSDLRETRTSATAAGSAQHERNADEGQFQTQQDSLEYPEAMNELDALTLTPLPSLVPFQNLDNDNVATVGGTVSVRGKPFPEPLENTLPTPTPTQPRFAESVWGFSEQAEIGAPPTPSLTQQEDRPRTSNSTEHQLPRRNMLSSQSSHEYARFTSNSVPEAISAYFTPSRANLETSNVITVPDDAESGQEWPGAMSAKSQAASDDDLFVASSYESNVEAIVEAKAKLLEIIEKDEVSKGQSQELSKTFTDTNHAEPLRAGLRTSLSYYTPLHPQHLRPFLNVASSQVSCESLVDVIAVVSSPPKPPFRAEKGPRDWSTVFYIADPSSWALKNDEGGECFHGQVQVQCFIGGKTGAGLLPKADAGDVVQLTDFGVFSRNGKIGLLNRGPGSGWCVWRFRARKATTNGHALKDKSPVEEMRGAPVEISDEEREQMAKLREWWLEANPHFED